MLQNCVNVTSSNLHRPIHHAFYVIGKKFDIRESGLDKMVHVKLQNGRYIVFLLLYVGGDRMHILFGQT
jgi:hypothetical protein